MSEKVEEASPGVTVGSVERTTEDDNVHNVNTSNIFKKTAAKGHDEALDYLAQDSGDVFTYTDKEASIVRWKIDLLLMPLLTVSSMLTFLDKGTLSNASVFGLKDDLHLHGQQYNWLGSIFYFGYLVGQPLSAYLLHKLPVAEFFSANMFLWGVSLMGMAGANGFAGGATARIFLGLFEACVNPVSILLTAQYYTRKEHSLRSCIWWAGASIGAFFGDLVAWGLGHDHGSLNTWRYMFLVWGSATIFWSIVLFFFLPNSPWKMKFLSERQRKIAVLRVLSNHTGYKSNWFKFDQVVQCFKDPQAWIFFCISFVQCLPSGGLSTFNKLILTGLGFTNLQATIMSMPEHAVQLSSIIIAGVAGSYLTNFRCIVMVLSNIPPLVGSFIIYYEPSSAKYTRLAGVYILFTNTISFVMVMSLVASNFAGMTRKTTVSAMMFLGYSIGNLVAPQLFISSEAPRYPTGFRGMIASFIVLIVLAIILQTYLMYENRRRDKATGKVDRHTQFETDLLDLTDFEQPYFRYSY